MTDLTQGPHSTEKIASGVMVDWFADRRIVAYTLGVADEGIMEILTKKVNEVLKTWPKDRAYLALHDLSAPGIAVFYMVAAHYHILNLGIKPENRDYAESIIRSHEQPARVAIVLSMSLSGKVTQHSADLTAGEEASIVDYKTFFKREAALEWLAEVFETSTE